MSRQKIKIMIPFLTGEYFDNNYKKGRLKVKIPREEIKIGSFLFNEYGDMFRVEKKPERDGSLLFLTLRTVRGGYKTYSILRLDEDGLVDMESLSTEGPKQPKKRIPIKTSVILEALKEIPL